MILFELNHLPTRNSCKYEKICQLFRSIFRASNEIYSLGDMRVELERAKELIVWPIPAALINIQPHFLGWYNWARTQCKVLNLSYRNDMNSGNEIMQQYQQTLSCSCHPPLPYKTNELWSLQKAFLYGCNLLIDKSCTLSHWSQSLTSNHSSLSQQDRMKMIHYATHDVMTVTFLIRPITETWTFEKAANRKIHETFVALDSVKLPTLSTATSIKKKINNINAQKLSKILTSTDLDIESMSSDDEIYLNQLIEPVINDYHREEQVKNNDDEMMSVNSHIVAVNKIG